MFRLLSIIRYSSAELAVPYIQFPPDILTPGGGVKCRPFLFLPYEGMMKILPIYHSHPSFKGNHRLPRWAFRASEKTLFPNKWIVLKDHEEAWPVI